MKTFKDEILNIAHRGASGHAPENTMAAFKRAYELGADGVELDVQLTKDGGLVICHDDNLKRTTNGKGNISDVTLDEIRQLDAGSWFSNDFRGEKVPLLDELLEYARGKLLVDIEIKTTPRAKEVVERVADAVSRFDMAHQCLITSFDVNAVNWALQLLPNCPAGLLVHNVQKDEWEGDWEIVAAKGTHVNPEVIDRIKQKNKYLFIWTVNELKDLQLCVAVGAGRVITNYPDRYNFVLQNQKNLDS